MPKLAHATGSAFASLIVMLVLCLFGGPLCASALGQGETQLQRDATARDGGAPRIDRVRPSPAEQIVNKVGLDVVEIGFDRQIAIPPIEAIRVWGVRSGPIDFERDYDPRDRVLRLRLEGAPRDDLITIVLDDRVTAPLDTPLDGEIASPTSPLLPSGDGLPGGVAVLRYRVLQGDANRDGVVDLQDQMVILDSIDRMAGEPGFDPRADLDGDGAVNIFDLLVWVEGALRWSLPVPDADPPVLVALDPPAGLFDAPIAQVRATFDKELAPQHVDPRALHAADRFGVVRWPASVEFEGDALLFAFDPPLEACNRYTIGLSGALADGSGALLAPVWPRPVYDALIPPATPTITPPATPTTQPTVWLGGRADRAAQVEATGPAGTVRVDTIDGSYLLEAPLRADSVNTIFVTAISACGVRSAAATTRVVMDTQPPTLHIDFPSDGGEVTAGSVTVAGRVGDMLSGFMGLSVRVNGVAAVVDPGIGTNGTFEARGVPLNPVGEPTRLEAVATDALGNRTERSITITRAEIPAGVPSMSVVGGADQTGRVGEALTEPIEVLVLRGDGSPFAGKIVTFGVTRSDGRLSATPGGPGGPGALTLQVAAGSDGVARAWWTLGGDAGCGNNRVTATSRDVAGSTFFCASATPGPASQINAGMGGNQVGQAGATLAMPFVAWLSDGANPVRNRPVTFAVVQGDGTIDGEREVRVFTDSAGRAMVELALGETPGLNVVQASFDGMAGLPASFTARGIARSDTRPTTFDGLVVDNNGRPIGGAEVVLGVNGVFFEPVLTDVAGRFEILDVPEGGPAELNLDALVATTLDGEPIDPGSFPSMHMEGFVVVQGAANAMAMPMALPELNPANAVSYDGTEDVVLTVEGVEGVEFTIRAGSMTLADGTRPSPGQPAVVALNQVHFDEVPMPLPDGVAVPFTWTLQPSEAVFDPPVEVSMPNFTGEPAGASTFLISFNHDTGRFDIVGTATVDSQGAFIRSDAGSGIPIAGWGAPRPPPPPTGSGGGKPGDGPECEATGCCPKTNPNGTLWRQLLLFGRMVARLGSIVFGVGDIIDCGLGIPVTVASCKAAYQDVRDIWTSGGTPTGEQIGRVLACANDIKSTSVDCIQAMNRVPDPGELAQEISDILNAIEANLEFYTSTPCLTSPLVNRILSILQRGVQLADRAVSLVEKWSLRKAALAAACTLSEEIERALRPDSPSDIVAELDRIFDELDSTVAMIGQLDAEILADIDDMDVLSSEMLDDSGPILEHIGNPLLANCTITAAGQSVVANEFGGFVLRGIPVTEDLQRLVATCTDADGNTLYAVSDFFRLDEGELAFPGGLDVLSPELPPTPVRLAPDSNPSVLEIGQQTQVTITGAMSDGGVADLTARDEGTTYRTSNPAIATVGEGGLVTANGIGTAFITASNQGVSAVRRIFVTRDTAPTTVRGFVVGPDGEPFQGALVTLLAFGGEDTTSADGSFIIDATLPGEGASLTVVATATIGEQQFFGTAASIPAVLGGVTDAGVIALAPLCDNPQWAEGLFGVNGVSGTVSALTVFDDGTGPALYAGGIFTSAGGMGARRIARWDGSAWTPLGDGMSNGVSALTVFDDGTGPALYAGGAFTIAGGVAANSIARWDGAAWTPLGEGVSGGSLPTVRALTVFDDGTGPALYAGGQFTTAGGVAANRIARWDGAVWTPLGDGMNEDVLALTVFDDGTGPALYAGGRFNTAGGVAANRIAHWDGLTWTPLGDGMNNSVNALMVFDDGAGPALYVGGEFTTADGVIARRIARWDGAAWTALGTGITSTSMVLALTEFDDGAGPSLYAGGSFTSAGLAANRIARWDGSAWSQLGTGINGMVWAMEVFDDGAGPALYAGGEFNTAGGVFANRIARWDGAVWSPLGAGLNSTVWAMTVFDDGSGPALYVGGRFATPGGVADRIARWDGSTWAPLGTGMSNTVHALEVFDDGTGPALYAGGNFTTAGGVPANNIARWDGSAWTPLGTGVNSTVSALTVFDDDTGPALYAGGFFDTAGGTRANRIARWDGSAWTPLGDGMNRWVRALKVFDDGTGPALYAGGEFSTAGGVTANRIARWDGVTWSPVGSGIGGDFTPTVRVLAVFDDGTGPALYAGGWFTTAGGVDANLVARWDGSAWAPLGSGLGGGGGGGVSPSARAMTVFDDGAGPALFAGGQFTTAGGVVSAYMAKWGCGPLGATGGPGLLPTHLATARPRGAFQHARPPAGLAQRQNTPGRGRANPPGGPDGGPLADPHANPADNALLDPDAPLDPDTLLTFIEDLGPVGLVEQGTLEIRPVNDRGAATGALETAMGRYLPYRATPTPDGPMTDLLGLLPEHDPPAAVGGMGPGAMGHGWGLSIDDQGRVVGVSAAIGPGGEDLRAVLWTHRDGPVDLGTLLPEGSGWQLHEAVAFDDASRIVGVGTLEGRQRAFRLTLRARPPRGDLDGDGRVDTFDMLAMLAAMEQGDVARAPEADLNGDGVIDLLDAALLVELLADGGR